MGPTGLKADASLAILTRPPIATVTRRAEEWRRLVSIYPHTCAKLIKAELIQVFVIF